MMVDWIHWKEIWEVMWLTFIVPTILQIEHSNTAIPAVNPSMNHCRNAIATLNTLHTTSNHDCPGCKKILMGAGMTVWWDVWGAHSPRVLRLPPDGWMYDGMDLMGMWYGDGWPAMQIWQRATWQTCWWCMPWQTGWRGGVPRWRSIPRRGGSGSPQVQRLHCTIWHHPAAPRCSGCSKYLWAR